MLAWPGPRGSAPFTRILAKLQPQDLINSFVVIATDDKICIPTLIFLPQAPQNLEVVPLQRTYFEFVDQHWELILTSHLPLHPHHQARHLQTSRWPPGVAAHGLL